MRRILFVLSLLTWSCICSALSPENESKNQPVSPFRIIGNIYYVGASEVTSYLIVTSAGLILIDGGFNETAKQIERNIATLGFKISDVKILLNGHAHPDHAGGLAELKRDTGARFEAMKEEVVPLQNEGRGTFYRGAKPLFESIKVDEQIADGDSVTLGTTKLVAHLTAGHSPGCTTWSTDVKRDNVTLHVVIVCQITLPAGQALVDNAFYPTISTDFKHTFATLKALPCDVFLAEHASAFALQAKMNKAAADRSTNAFIDPAGYRRLIDQSQTEFESALSAEQDAAAGKH